MQDYQKLIIRDALILTNAFVIGNGTGDENVIGGDKFTQQEALKNQLMLYVDFTIGSLNSAEIRIEFSHDNTNWFREVDDAAVSGGFSVETIFDRQLTATGLYRLALPTKDSFIRISAQGTGTVDGSSLEIIAAPAVA